MGIGVKAKNVWMNFTEAIPKYLQQIHKFLPNGRLNNKCIFSKFRLTHNIPVKDIIMTLKEALKDYNIFAKSQLI